MAKPTIVEDESKIEFVDLTPEWSVIVVPLIDVLHNPEVSRATKSEIRSNLLRMYLHSMKHLRSDSLPPFHVLADIIELTGYAIDNGISSERFATSLSWARQTIINQAVLVDNRNEIIRKMVKP